MRLYKTVHKRRVNDISSDVKPYQRDIESNRLKRIIKSIEEDGYWPQESLVLNQDNECVDGQHRLQAAKDCRIEEVPCVIYHFDSLEEEAKMFSKINSHNTKLKPIDVWHSKFIWGCPIAKMIYKLNEDPTSPFRGIIKVKGNNNGKITINALIQLMNTLCFNLRAPHYRDSDSVNSRMQSRFANLDWNDAIRKGVMFLNWLNIFAEYNSSWYNQPSIPPIAIIYKSLEEQGKFSDHDKKEKIAEKIRSIDTNNNDWKTCRRSTKINMIAGHLRRTYRAYLSDFDPFIGNNR